MFTGLSKELYDIGQEEGRQEGREEGRQEGEKLGLTKGRQEGKKEGLIEGQISTFISLVRDGLLSIKEATKRLNISEEEFIKRISLS